MADHPGAISSKRDAKWFTSMDSAFFVKSDQDLAPCVGDLARSRHHRDGYTVATVTLGAVQSLIRGAQ